LDELVDALTRDAEHHGDFRHADQVLGHGLIVDKVLTIANQIGYY
jgi:hypothetical protein